MSNAKLIRILRRLVVLRILLVLLVLRQVKTFACQKMTWRMNTSLKERSAVA